MEENSGLISTSGNGKATDSGDLQKFGYRQQLNRAMGGFSSFAISFSLISVLTGIYANFNFGFQQVGGAIVWSWLLVGGGQFMVALVMADLSARFPVTGYGYQWSARLVNPHFGFFVGWLLLMQFITGFPGTSQALAVTLSSMTGGESSGWNVSFITLAIISSVTLIHLYGIRMVTRVNNLGVYAELAGVAFLIASLAVIWFLAGSINTEKLFSSVNMLTSKTAGFSSMALSLLLGAWCLTGFEAAADLAEETHAPRKNVPRAVITSQVIAALAGFLILMLMILSVDNIRSAQNNSNSLMFILKESIGIRLTTMISIIVMVSIFACAVASMATATRLLFSLSRDSILPFSAYLSRVNAKTKTPQWATVVVWIFSCLTVISFRRIEIITSVGAVATYLGYSGIMLATILNRKKREEDEGFSLGRWKLPVQILALVWTLGVVAALTIPGNSIPGIPVTHLAALSAITVIVIGIILYFSYVRSKIIRGIAGPPKQLI